MKLKFSLQELDRLKAYLKGEATHLKWMDDRKYKLIDGVVYVGDQRVIPLESVDETISNYYKNPNYVGGRDALFDHLKKETIGISKSAVANWLKTAAISQVTAPNPKRATVRVTVPNDVGEVSAMDLVDMSNYASKNDKVHYLLTYIDALSKFAHVRPLKNKEQESVLKALKDILDSSAAYPSIIRSDRGAEWGNKVESYLKDHDVKLVKSQPYNPQSNGTIERFNRTIKHKIFQYMAANGTGRYIDALQSLVNNYNSSEHGTTREVPYDIVTGVDDEHLTAIKQRVQNRVKASPTIDNFKVGDIVRVSLLAFSTERRNKFRKSINQNWSSNTWTIRSRSDADDFTAAQYLLHNNESNRDSKKKFWGYQLLHAAQEELKQPPDTSPPITEESEELPPLRPRREKPQPKEEEKKEKKPKVKKPIVLPEKHEDTNIEPGDFVIVATPDTKLKYSVAKTIDLPSKKKATIHWYGNESKSQKARQLPGYIDHKTKKIYFRPRKTEADHPAEVDIKRDAIRLWGIPLESQKMKLNDEDLADINQDDVINSL